MATCGKLVVGLLMLSLLCAMLDRAASCGGCNNCCNGRLHEIMDVSYMFELCDLDDNKVVTMTEAKLALPATSTDDIRQAFESFDFNGDGRITENELARPRAAFDLGED